MSTLSIKERAALIASIAENGGEIIGAEELETLLSSGKDLYTYDGFEPSGQMHIAQGIVRAINVNKMIEAGFTFRMWVADWFGYLNNKMGGDLDKIKMVGKYFVEIWKASGMNLDKTEFLWTSDFVGQRWYWELVMKVAKAITLKRALRTTAIMGRSDSDELSAGQIFYPCMQIADIFGVMHAQVTQLGLDQQKVNVLAREVGEELGYWKPIIVSHGMLQGLQKPVELKIKELKDKDIKIGEDSYIGAKIILRVNDLKPEVAHLSFLDKTNHSELRAILLKLWERIKYFDLEITYVRNEAGEYLLKIQENTDERKISMKMSKSKPDTAIFMTDPPEEVTRKIMKAYCPEGIVEDNPIFAYCQQVIFNAKYLKRAKPLLENGMFIVKREEKFGGNISFNSYDELAVCYLDKKLFPLDLKNAVIGYLNELLQPVRDHFANNKEAKKILEKVKSYETTR